MSTAIPTEYQVYNSYVVDPTYQLKFTIAWTSVTAAFVVASLPILLRKVRDGRMKDAFFGVTEDIDGRRIRMRDYDTVAKNIGEVKKKDVKSCVTNGIVQRAQGCISFLRSISLFTVPAVGLDLGQVIIIIAYYVLLLLCVTLHSELIDNPNRAGFLAIAQLPVIFLLATKSSPLSILLGDYGYEKLNVLHRWSGRGAFLCAAIHGALWINNHIVYDIQILGAQKETSGVATFALLGVIVLSSLRPVRALCYQAFYVIHMLAVVAFFVTLCYHTIYAPPYIYPPMAFYGFDLFFRMVRTRVKDATLIPADEEFTIIRVENTDGGWSPGAHVRLRTFIGARMFESHPMTIMNAPSQTSCLPGSSHTMFLGARALGDWSKALNKYARTFATHPSIASEEKAGDRKLGEAVEITDEIIIEGDYDPHTLDGAKLPSPSKPTARSIVPLPSMADWTPSSAISSTPITVMLDGPYGGCPLDLTSSSHVLLLAGGSGITFTLGLLDHLCGSITRHHAISTYSGTRSRRVDLLWCVRGFGAISWAAPMLSEVAERVFAYNEHQATLSENERRERLDVRIRIYVTCLCTPERVPPIRGCSVSIEKPSVAASLHALLSSSTSSSLSSTTTSGSAASSQVDLEVGVGSATQDEKISKSKMDDMGGVDTMPWSRVAVCAAGPESMVRAARNAAAKLALREPSRVVECHTETYSF